MEKHAPLKRIAEILGISKMTVSRALREGTSVSAELRSKVRDTAQRLGYQPDSRISQVMSAIRKAQTSHYRETLAFVWTHRTTERKKLSSIFDEEFEGARHRAHQLGYTLDIFRMTEESLTGGTLSRVLHSRGIRGALIAPLNFDHLRPHIWMDWKLFACVLLGRSFANRGLPRVQHDHYFSCVLALRRLKRLHYKRIGLVISHSMDERSDRLVRSAFLSFHPLGFIEAEKLIFVADHYDPKALRKWIGPIKPEVILANFEHPFPHPDQIRSNAPKQIDLAALNWSEQQPDIAGVDQHRFAIGEQAVDLLLLRLQGHKFGLDMLAPSINLPGTWKEASSIRAAKHPRKHVTHLPLAASHR
jgi:LacI family transcriptional regulator